MLVADRITVCSRGATLLDGVSLTLEPGELVAVVGPNGAGKSTLLKNLCGEWVPERGAVSLNGRRLSNWPHKARARRLAVLPQHTALNFPFRVEDVVLMGRSPHVVGGENDRDREIVRQALVTADIEHLKDRIYTHLSGGERQRVHLARVLSQVWESSSTQPCYLLLDEPTSALDLAHQHRLMDILHDWANRKSCGVLIILHDLNLAASYADRVCVLKSGRLMGEGSPAKILCPDLIGEVYQVAVSTMPHPRINDRIVVIT